jgi:sigma-B regulation protein RsbU (phosphoserine phosphatase)
VLGVFPDGRFEQVEIQLNTGDRLVLFTDGITEAQDQEGGEFGEERLLRLALQTRHMSARDVQRTILDAARAFAGGTFADDATLIVMVTNRFGN